MRFLPYLYPMPLRYYTDENINPNLNNVLTEKGLDVLSCQSAGMLGTSDIEQLLFVTKEKRLIITRDDDFLKWHRKGAKHMGIIYIHPKMTDADAIKGILNIHENHSAQIQKKPRRVYVIQPKTKQWNLWKWLKNLFP